MSAGIIHHASERQRKFTRENSSVSERESGGSARLNLIKFRFPSAASRTENTPPHGPVRKRNASRQSRRGDAPLLPRLRDERDRGPGASGRARRAEAGAPARALCDARGEQRVEPSLR